MNRPPKTKLAVALGGALLALSAMSASAAGLGKLSVSSALGQPLTAEIELVSLQPGEFESIAARVASPDSYNDAKIEYTPLLRQLRFAVERRSDGKPVLKITSSAPINEPFLDVLVEMNWPAGRLLREYPLLLDPPGFSEARISPPVATVTPVRPSAPVLVPVTPTPPPVASSAPAPAPANTPTVSTAPSGTPSAQSESGGDTYGPVKRGDTLNKIAQEMKTDTVSLEQMLVALYRENKAAFIDNNMNRLRTGQILKVPSAADVSKIAEKDARSEIKVQVASWQAYREQVAGNTSAAAPSTASPTNQAGGKITVAKADTPAPSTVPKDQLKIAKTDGVPGKAGTPGGTGASNLQDQLNALKEEKIARENSLKEANSRVADLEKQISDMRKLMELKGLAGKTTPEPAKIETKVAQVTPTPPPVKLPEPVKTPDVKTPAPDVKPADTKPADTKPADTKPGDTKVEPPKVEPPKVVDSKPADSKPPLKAPAKAAPPPPPEPSFLEDNMVAIGAGGAALLGVGGLFAFMSRRKKKPGSSNTSMSKTSSIMPSDLKPNTVTGNRGGGLVDTGNSSFLTDFDKTGPGSIDTDEVDPVAEAEVYIAYGRDAQAEEILKEAMSRDKSRHEITVKLLEIYHARKSVQSFETVARELKETIGGDNPMWAKVAAMGSSIDPQNPLYSGSGQAYETTGAFAAGGASVMAAAAATGDKAPPDVDFDLGFTGSGATSPTPISAFDVTSPNSDQPAGGGMDFDLDLNTGGAASAATAPAGGGLDFDLALDSPAHSAAAAPAPAESSGFDFDLSNLSMDSDATKPANPDFTKTIATHATTAEKSGMPSLADLSLDLDVPGDGPSASEGPSAVSTKLELAKAYIEIGDSEGAKEILTEVSREGSPAQQAEAKKILAGM